jgi:hypothetical protein
MANYLEQLIKENNEKGNLLPHSILEEINSVLQKYQNRTKAEIPIDFKILEEKLSSSIFLTVDKIKDIDISGYELSITSMVVKPSKTKCLPEKFIQVMITKKRPETIKQTKSEHKNGRKNPAKRS